jgi:peptide/nickel transport system substrate-binding protein
MATKQNYFFNHFLPWPSRRAGRRRFLSGAGAGGIGLALAACGGRTTTGQRTGAASSAAGTPKPGGTFRMYLPDDIASFDASTSAKNETNETVVAYNRLLRFKSGPGVQDDELTLQPELAQSWETPDSQTYTFHLRNGVKFADLAPVNGRGLTATDVKFSYEYATRTGQFSGPNATKKLLPPQYNWMLDGLDSIETPDASTVVVRFSQPYAPFLNYTTTAALPILPHEIYDQDGDFSKHIVGTGPFQFDPSSSQHDTRSVWKKNPTYWETGQPYMDQFTYLIIPDPSTAYAAFQTGQLDWLSGATATATTINEIRKANPNAASTSYLAFVATDLWMNQTPGALLADARLRQAIGLAIDRDDMINTLGGGKGAWALAGVFPDTFTQDEVKQILKYDPQQAKQLLSAAGYPNGLDIEFQYTTDYGALYVSLVQLLQSQVKKAGINITFKVLDRQDVIQRRKSANYTMQATGSDVYVDIDSLIYQKFMPGSTGNNSRVNDPTLTAMLQAQRREFAAAKRKDIIRQAATYIADHSLGYVTYYSQLTEFWHPYLKGYAPNFGNAGGTTAPNIEAIWQEK